MSKGFTRRDFMRIGLTGMSAIAVGIPFKTQGIFSNVQEIAAQMPISLTITDAMVEMIDLNPVYHWVFADMSGPKFPGPAILATEGDIIHLSIANTLDEPHAFAVSGTEILTPPIPPNGGVENISFPAPRAGTYIYHDPLNAPVNRVLGLHGLLVVLPAAGNTPYSDPTEKVQRLFNDLGTTDHFPGNPWSPSRTFIWDFHQIDPFLNRLAEPAGAPPIDPMHFIARFLPRYFTISGKSGHFSSDDFTTTPNGRVGQPALVRIVNTGLATHSPHLHANHFYVVSVNGEVQRSVEFLDTFTVRPMDRIDWLIPFIRPPDMPSVHPNNPKRLIRLDAAEELAFIPPTNDVQLSPMEYPMHCHTEMSQTAAGGNYNAGLLSHIVFTGDIDGVEFPHGE